tara:strand:- start:5856 stop:6245 length:390 start_codon:yes stop_codon:yes gene_type:complete
MELIKLKVKQVAGKGEAAKMIVYSFIQACTKLDASILEPLINEDQLFDDLDKYRFLDFLKGQFDYAKELGFTETIMQRGKCGLCIIGHSTFEFYGKDGKIRFAYIIEEKEGEIKNIFNCNASSGWHTKG